MDVRYGGLTLLLPLTAMAIDDFRHRKVAIVWLIVFAVLAAANACLIHGMTDAVVNMVTNMLLLLYVAIGVTVYIRIRHGRWVDPLQKYVGAGDVVFLAAATPLLDMRGYLLMLIGASVFSLVWMTVARAVGQKMCTIPFVTTAGMALCAAMTIKLL